jgi:superfamily I DNA/RNA helicase
MKSFIGRGENEYDRSVIFVIYKKYEAYFSESELLDSDDVVLSMAARLTSSLWDRQRRTLGYDFVLVDETHLFNENERRVLPYLTRTRGEYLPLIMTFDEAQSIGGRRSGDLDTLGIGNSERKTLKAVHRSSPDILALARDLIARSSLVFSEFDGTNERSTMTKTELRRTSKPRSVGAVGRDGVVAATKRECEDLRNRNYQRIGVILFDQGLLPQVDTSLESTTGGVHKVRERGELGAALPKSGTFLMSPENCGGLEFDAVILVGVDEGIVPPSITGLSPHGYLSVEEEAFKELYTAVTRAKFQLVLITDSQKGLSPLLRPSLESGHLIEG